ncbi:hypothetical protein PR003_g1005 [Phytophthora rubi]|uniref:AB hydrolase-1 domain-containing protein n=1 Tax=Phytophthora rubi TaxID=129364 RepID=A0A6A4G8Q1_9STRA|nr:hypothetical protein PR001_g788 [Phytophthora rubi]KAE9358977.1 hypothetical protein PR003_g1005 [Phytophthora rubi]
MEKKPKVTLLLAHACGFSKDMWAPVVRRLQEIPALQRVEIQFVSFDFPYHGRRSDVSLAETLTVNKRNPKAVRVSGECDDVKSWYLKTMPQQVERVKRDKPADFLIGVGFSMGSGALWAMEVAHPGTFDALILFEPTLDTKTPRTEAVRSYLIASTLKRPSFWPSRAAAETYFSTTEAFGAWDREAWAAHLVGALKDEADGSVSLACDPRLEASLYSMEALHFSDMELQQPKCPIRFHWGTNSHMCFEKMLKAIETKFPSIYTTRKGMPGLGHLVVMEDPELTANNIAQELQQLEPFAQAKAKL